MRRATILLSKLPNAPVGGSVRASSSTKTAPKAVSLEESKTAIPNTTSTTESMMPWEGWFSSLLRSKMGDEKYERFRGMFLFRPDDVHGLEQSYRPNTRIRLTDQGDEAVFRHPSPGSQDPVRLPDADEGHYREDPYNVAYYPTDTRRRGQDPAFPHPETEALRIEMMMDGSDDPRVEEARKKLEEGPGSSPGNKGTFATGRSDYDPTGLRATMSANHEAMNKELDKVMPNHLPTYSWVERQDEIMAWHEENDLPLPMGGFEHTYIPTEGRVARW